MAHLFRPPARLRAVLLLGWAILGSAAAPGSAQAEVTTASGAAYAQRCRDAGVPLPPTWGTTAWKYNGTMAVGTTMIIKSLPANVYFATSTSPAGLCMSLPRNDGNIVNPASFGVICQGSNGKVCFWDNSRSVPWNTANGDTVFSAQKVIASTNSADLDGTFIGGAALAPPHGGGMCTDCHAGKNAFIMIPNTPLDLRPKGVTMDSNAAWYDPIVPSGFLQNLGPGSQLETVTPPSGQQSCLLCHNNSAAGPKFPPVGVFPDGKRMNYCNTILQQSKDMNKMPPSGVSGDFTAHWDALLGKFCVSAMPQQPTPPMEMPPSPRLALDPALVAGMAFLLQ